MFNGVLYVHVRDVEPLLYKGLSIEKFMELLQIYVENLSWRVLSSTASNIKSYLQIKDTIENYDVRPLLIRLAEIYKETLSIETDK